jgi:hypothetical protein
LKRDFVMSLKETSKARVGHSLFVLPYYGYGWVRKDLAVGILGPLDKLGPEPFHLRIEEFLYCEKQIMGITGRIEEPGHGLDKHWCACLLRNTDDSDFTTHPGQYMIWVAEEKLSINPAPYPQKALAEWVTFDKSKFCLSGYGAVAESVEWIQELHKQTMDSRRRAEGMEPGA